MIRTNRQVLRLFFILVIGMGLFGGWYASHSWQRLDAELQTPGISQDIDWTDLISSLGEEAIQLFLGLTSSSDANPR